MENPLLDWIETTLEHLAAHLNRDVRKTGQPLVPSVVFQATMSIRSNAHRFRRSRRNCQSGDVGKGGRTSTPRTGWGLLNAAPREAICSYKDRYRLSFGRIFVTNEAIRCLLANHCAQRLSETTRCRWFSPLSRR